MRIEAKGVEPEVVAAIAAAIESMLSKEKTAVRHPIAVRIRRTSHEWSLAARGGRH
ncbi:MAG: methylmalonyl-CoA carboxyltransferase [Selenomonadaceae bacterium]|nr:methylmalonyl-CoA carboxyltransferase [Selenomonadaceae bacterium]MDY2685193.1 methylmalonyl-CoA carboxyltransferase [Selenomonadaceae bacterium]